MSYSEDKTASSKTSQPSTSNLPRHPPHQVSVHNSTKSSGWRGRFDVYCRPNMAYCRLVFCTLLSPAATDGSLFEVVTAFLARRLESRDSHQRRSRVRLSTSRCAPATLLCLTASGLFLSSRSSVPHKIVIVQRQLQSFL